MHRTITHTRNRKSRSSRKTTGMRQAKVRVFSRVVHFTYDASGKNAKTVVTPVHIANKTIPTINVSNGSRLAVRLVTRPTKVVTATTAAKLKSYAKLQVRR